ncbi:DUF4855 domain-containing protein [Chitinophaga qingshengii]|uniref:DUF4855 domain-containing protein n=1 Tax=Chitinophaga qingshengii TaxID=1569794 RepID=A0ABR7TZQ5_9BACT|nr:DUF4855 domain-containing protein [Chitinophaga qingshengii]MBC9934929.1 DUF4855 domain-containing protein [Chitinophaga qingshengii]
MKKNILLWILMLLAIPTTSCNKKYMYPDYDGNEKKDTTATPPAGTDDVQKTSIRDLVLIYGGGADGPQTWTKDAFYPYVAYDDNATTDWMFDGFLFLELKDGNGHAYTTGHSPEPALKEHWDALISKYFRKGYSFAALDECITGVIAKTGTPTRKRKVIVGIPEPMKAATQWGTLNGKMLDFSKDADRITACKWFMDQVKEKFTAAAYANIELEGFYWIAEEVENTAPIIASIGDYSKKGKNAFLWIPWWKSPGYDNYKPYGFSDVYLQPNYFFADDVPYARLQEACNEANKYHINLEVEFDERVLGGKGQKLYDYLEVFEQNKVYDTKKLAYYQSENTILKLYQSTNTADKDLYKRLCGIIVKRQKAAAPAYMEK